MDLLLWISEYAFDFMIILTVLGSLLFVVWAAWTTIGVDPAAVQLADERSRILDQRLELLTRYVTLMNQEAQALLTAGDHQPMQMDIKRRLKDGVKAGAGRNIPKALHASQYLPHIIDQDNVEGHNICDKVSETTLVPETSLVAQVLTTHSFCAVQDGVDLPENESHGPEERVKKDFTCQVDIPAKKSNCRLAHNKTGGGGDTQLASEFEEKNADDALVQNDDQPCETTDEALNDPAHNGISNIKDSDTLTRLLNTPEKPAAKGSRARTVTSISLATPTHNIDYEATLTKPASAPSSPGRNDSLCGASDRL